MRTWVWGAVGIAAALGLSGCGAETDNGSGGSGAATTTSSTASGTGGGGNSGSGGAGGTMSSGTGGMSGGYCAKSCSAPSDCCPPGAPPTCPNEFPWNFGCMGGICQAAQCAGNADCTDVFGMNYVCELLQGKNSCIYPCSSDTDCTAPAMCGGLADDGTTKFCKVETPGCMIDDECTGFGKCIGGSCVCEQSSDCTSPGFDTCVMN